VNDQADRRDEADEEFLTCSVSDEILERAGGSGGGAAISLISTADRCIVC
jgi:hypothetical protein